MSDILAEAEGKLKKLFLPWTYFKEEDQIYSQQDDTEYDEYGGILSEGKELIAEFHGKDRSKEIIDAVNLLPGLITEIKRLREQVSMTQQKAGSRRKAITDISSRLKKSQEQCNDLMANCDHLRDRCQKAESELNLWRGKQVAQAALARIKEGKG